MPKIFERRDTHAGWSGGPADYNDERVEASEALEGAMTDSAGSDLQAPFSQSGHFAGAQGVRKGYKVTSS